MNKISEIISLPVISLYESQYCGIITNILFDYKQKKCKYAIIVNENDNIPKILKLSDIFKIGKDCIFIKNKTKIQLESNYSQELESLNNPINLNSYNLDGEYLGCCTDIIINNSFYINEIILDSSKKLPTCNIFNMGEIVLFDSNKISMKKFQPRQSIQKTKTNTIANTESRVVILSNNQNNQELQTHTSPETSNQNTKIITDFRFLIGRILSKDIIAFNGEVVAKKDSIITKDIVNKASGYGKLVEIARYSNKKNT